MSSCSFQCLMFYDNGRGHGRGGKGCDCWIEYRPNTQLLSCHHGLCSRHRNECFSIVLTEYIQLLVSVLVLLCNVHWKLKMNTCNFIFYCTFVSILNISLWSIICIGLLTGRVVSFSMCMSTFHHWQEAVIHLPTMWWSQKTVGSNMLHHRQWKWPHYWTSSVYNYQPIHFHPLQPVSRCWLPHTVALLLLLK